MKILYLHGFNSAYNPEDPKVKLLKKEFGSENVNGLTYDTFADYHENMDNVLHAVRSAADDLNDVCVFGTSLGGYYAIEACRRLGVPAIACNPSMNPCAALGPMEGQYFKNFVNGWCNILSHDMIASYAAREIHSTADAYNVIPLVLLNMSDPIIDNKGTLDRYRSLGPIPFDSDDHRFSNLADAMPEIKKYFSALEYVSHLD